LPFSIVPFIVSAQQLSESFIWDSNAENRAAISFSFAFLLILLPVGIPVAIISLELTRPNKILPMEQIVWVFRCEIKQSSRFILLFLSLFAGLSVAIFSVLDIVNGIGADISRNRIIYSYNHHQDIVYRLISVLYSLAIFAPILLSSVSHLSMYLAGIPLALITAVSIAIYYSKGSAPVWCFLLVALNLVLFKILLSEIGFRQRNSVENEKLLNYGSAPVEAAEV